jgi:hypothetical protein
MQDPLDAFRDQTFYWEARRLQDEQRRRLGIGRESSRPSNVVSFREFRERRLEGPVDRPPTKPAA